MSKIKGFCRNISHTFSFLPALFDKLPAHAVTRSVSRTRDNKALLRDSGTPLIFAGQSRGMWDGGQVCEYNQYIDNCAAIVQPIPVYTTVNIKPRKVCTLNICCSHFHYHDRS